MVKGYWIGRIAESDRNSYQKYVQVISPAVGSLEGRFLVNGGESIQMDGEQSSAKIAIIEFPSLSLAEEFYASEVCRNAIASSGLSVSSTIEVGAEAD